jgi:hypothetical protein
MTMTNFAKSMTLAAALAIGLGLQGCMVIGATTAVAGAAAKTTIGVAGAAVNATGQVIGAAGNAVTGH